jgi:hypothetical protein
MAVQGKLERAIRRCRCARLAEIRRIARRLREARDDSSVKSEVRGGCGRLLRGTYQRLTLSLREPWGEIDCLFPSV